MATYTEFQQSEIASDRQHTQGVSVPSISEILDHGSISFGRFAAESLAWEKWSIFQPNRCQEELEMYKANGLVAQKKAYFEEYYKRVRALKALKAENQEAAQPVPSPDVKISTTDLTKEGKLGNDTVANSDSSVESMVDKPGQASIPLNDYNENADKVIMTEETSNASSSVELEHSTNKTSLSATPLITRSSGAGQHNSLVSDPVKRDSNEPKKPVPVLKVKGNAALARNKPKLDCKTTKDAFKSSEKSKPRPLNQITGKRDTNLLPRKTNTFRGASENNCKHVSSHKKLTEVCSGATVLHASSTRNRLVPSPLSGRSIQKKPSTNGKDLADRLHTNLPLHARPVQNHSKEKSIPSNLKDIDKRSSLGVTRKPLDLGNQQMPRKVGQSENQRPKSMFTNNPARNKSNQNIGGDLGCKNYGKERRQKEGGEESNVTRSRDTKSASTVASSIPKNLKLVHKTAESRSRGLSLTIT